MKLPSIALAEALAEIERLRAECELMRPIFVAALRWRDVDSYYELDDEIRALNKLAEAIDESRKEQP